MVFDMSKIKFPDGTVAVFADDADETDVLTADDSDDIIIDHRDNVGVNDTVINNSNIIFTDDIDVVAANDIVSDYTVTVATENETAAEDANADDSDIVLADDSDVITANDIVSDYTVTVDNHETAAIFKTDAFSVVNDVKNVKTEHHKVADYADAVAAIFNDDSYIVDINNSNAIYSNNTDHYSPNDSGGDVIFIDNSDAIITSESYSPLEMKIINAVKTVPRLYDGTRKNTEKLWIHIAKPLGMTPEEAKKIWKKIRNNFSINWNMNRDKNPKYYPILVKGYDEMNFIIPYMKPRITRQELLKNLESKDNIVI